MVETGDWEAITARIAERAGATVDLGRLERRRPASAVVSGASALSATPMPLTPDGDEIIRPLLLKTLLQLAEALADRVYLHWDTTGSRPNA
jgi:hypothetical protein